MVNQGEELQSVKLNLQYFTNELASLQTDKNLQTDKLVSMDYGSKGPLILKGHFVVFNSLKNRTKNFCPSRLGQKFEFSSSFFFGELEAPKRHFEIN